MKISESLSRQLTTVTFVATILVVMCHCDDFMKSFGFCFNLTGFVCFLLGAEVEFSKMMRRAFWIDGNSRVAALWIIAWICSAVCVFCLSGTAYQILHPFYVLFAVFCLHRAIACVPCRIGDVCVKSSFIIYASHLMILSRAAPVLNKVLGRFPILCFAALVVVAVLGGIGMMMCLRKMSRPALSLLTGGRG